MKKMINVDIAIIGGGMVGLTLAAALADSNLRIAIIESNKADPKLGEKPDIRVSALNRASENILKNLDVWQFIQAKRAQKITAMTVWEQDSFANIDFDPKDLGEQNLGYIVENRIIQLSLLEKVEKQDNVKFFCPDLCQSIMAGETENWLTLESGQSISAKLVVGADGANSWLRNQLDIPLTAKDYDHHALVANIKTAEPHQGVARQIFTPEGPLAFLPLTEPNLCSIVWSLPPDKAQELSQMDEVEFNKHLTASFDARLGLCSLDSSRMICPLKMRFARDFVADRAALIGDAAHTIHPLAGQGVNLGLLDAISLAQEILSLHFAGKDIGEKSNLRYFERWRKTEAAKMIAAMQGFHDLFDGSNPVKKLIRGIGVIAAGNLPFIKDKFIKQALGISGDLPSLAKSSSKNKALG